MGKRAMSERFVQDSVAERLNRDYYRRKPVYVATEAYTKLKRADVFLAFMRARKRPYVVVVEAKSRTTIHQLKLKDNVRKLKWTGRVVALVLIALLMTILGYQWYFNALNTVLLIGVFLLGSALITALIRRLELSSLRSASVIEQLGRYPANEQWIAVGEDTFVKDEEYDALRKQCRKNGIGLIVVTEKGKLRLKEVPKPKHTFNNYLDRYGKESEIRDKIDRKPDYGPTPSERRKTRRQITNAAVLLGAVIFLSTLVYEENVAAVVPDPFSDATLEVVPPANPRQDDLSDFGTPPFIPEKSGAPVAEDGCRDFVTDHRAFIVIDNLYGRAAAARRVEQLTAAGFGYVRSLPTECLNARGTKEGQYVVWTGELFPDRPAAKRAARTFGEALEAAGLAGAGAGIVKVRPRD